ncbi:hypothetical protein NOJ28_17085 [Neorhizobium galegae]|uniref:hypothetical protein n=1 Tax=Neorhizobium galegae TaxID=399 RepID=UPI000621323D|nr:hypothetical protein [Neorhizobium galegae]MCQ1767255.1 hypothetical protein [Neorhizobium galegae]MCQ1846801.1 hypothetical protein [Neorhizobium galegae]CDZ42059.1 Hypothetical protein NGAL_HAMBI1146_48250 [Neorhizobium galegae bv. officinalis]
MNTRFDPQEAETRHPNPIGSPPVVETATEARQGSWGAPVLKVLIGGLILAMVAWAGAEWYGQSTAPPAEQTATPPAGSTTPQNPNAPPTASPSAPPAAAPPATNSQSGN